MILTLTPSFKNKQGQYERVALYFGDSSVPAAIVDIEELYQSGITHMSPGDLYGHLRSGDEVVVGLVVEG